MPEAFTNPVPFNACCLALKVLKSVELKNPLIVELDWAILITLPEILNGNEAPVNLKL